MDVRGLAVPLISLAGVLAWVAVLGRLRFTAADTRIGGSMLLVAICLLVSAGLYVGLPFDYAAAFNVIARIIVLGSALALLLRHDP